MDRQDIEKDGLAVLVEAIRRGNYAGDTVKRLVCIEGALGVESGSLFPVLAETGLTWEILLGGEYRKVGKKSCRVQGWKDGPEFMPFQSFIKLLGLLGVS